jgi:hypothetical protein
MEPGLQQTMLLSLLQQIQAATIDAARTTTSTGGLLTITATAAANPGRRRFVIQNQKAEHLHVKFGTGCTASDYHYILQSAATAGTPGSSLIFEGYTGAISVAPVALNPSYTFAEFV